jgi:hypothetical protein
MACGIRPRLVQDVPEIEPVGARGWTPRLFPSLHPRAPRGPQSSSWGARMLFPERRPVEPAQSLGWSRDCFGLGKNTQASQRQSWLVCQATL